MQSVLIVGLGNANRGDDAAGLLAARELRRRGRGQFSVCEHEGDGLALIELWEARASVILIDAVYGARPGTIHRFDAALDRLPFAPLRHSTHTFGAGEAIELARALNRLPARLIVYGIESRDFTPGRLPSHAVRQAISELVRRIAEEINV